MLLFSLLIFVTRLLSVSTLDVLQLRHSSPNPNSNPIPAPTGTHLWSAFDCRQSSRERSRGRGHPLMTQCQAKSRLPTQFSALVAECLFSDWPRQRDTSGQDPFAAVLRCSLFELFAQPLQKRRQNELRGSQVEAQTDSRDSENRQTDRQRDRAPAPSSSGELKCSKMTKLISSPDTGLESFGLSMATDAAGTRQQQQQQGLLSN